MQREDATPFEEEQVQAKSISDTIQREEIAPEEEEPVQAKSISETIQREEVPEEEQLQGKSLKGGMAATPNLETSIQGARGSGQPLDEKIRQPMEKAFGGVDFSQVKVHHDAVSDQLNQSIQARAFTAGTDVFFRGGEYNPGSRGGQELLAHELTHVVQQSGGALHGGNKMVSFQKIQSSQIVQCDRTEKQKNYSAYHPNIRHDHGHLDDGNGNIDNSKRRSATAGDYTALAYWTAKLNVAEKLRPDLIDATDAYRHFLFGRGTTRTINYDRFIESDKSGQTIIQSAAKNILDKARKRHNEFLINNPGGDIGSKSFDLRTDVIPVGSDSSYPYPQTENWQKAIGAHFIWLEAHVNVDVNSSNKTRTFNMQMTLKMEDMYNFNPGAADVVTGTPDSANGRFEITGLANEYLNESTITRTFIVSEPTNSTSNSNDLINVNNPR